MSALSESTVPARSETALFGLLEAELIERGVSASVFSTLQRPWLWRVGGPHFSARYADRLRGLGARVPTLEEQHTSADGSTKVVVRLGNDRVEAVHMPRAVGNGRVTLCVSSQVGCAMGCAFCATARMGFIRHLSAGEIVAQVLAVIAALGPRHPGELTLVFMGMGEPLHNLPEVARAIAVLCEPRGLGLSPRRITVSTSGLVPEIIALGELEPRPLLAVSLNATTDSTRERLMPIGRRYCLSELRAALTHFPVRPRERIMLEYVLLSGVNDSAADAHRLARFCAPFPHQINLIPWNAHAGSEFRAPADHELDRFALSLLAETRAVVTVRRSRGRDVGAACGQLVQLRTA
ncbi:MAG TPA: 23S rRNA (adenine(2503)-C(2))-methyltransferase RlmN [Polyangiaceae bacterium]|jgi:23S rRNA (adenine2503-C2)-methyltransferase|nr:23S rRNA (adenine(2503)-C(2))-methyltransferase RlmN [Polyangiaceae bacterium]